ncbi:MAG: hypothetical protein Fur0041_03690 [Bacteroidia bacterium]
MLTFVAMRYLWIIAVLLISCAEEPVQTEKKPENLIPEEKMVKVLAEVHLLEAAIGLKSPQPRSRVFGRIDTAQQHLPLAEEQGDPLKYYDIFKKLGVTRGQYDASMKWYAAHPEELNQIYDKVIEELTKQQLKEQTGK